MVHNQDLFITWEIKQSSFKLRVGFSIMKSDYQASFDFFSKQENRFVW